MERVLPTRSKEVGKLIQDPRAPADPLDRAEGYRFLMRLVRYGFESFLEYSDPLHPVLHRGSHETIKIIHENPDNLYLGARVDGRHRYRVHGTLGTARWMSFNIHAGAFGSGGRGTAQALDARDLALGADRRLRAVPGRRAARSELAAAAARRGLADRAPDVRRPRERAAVGARDRAARRTRAARAARARARRLGRSRLTPAMMRALAEMALSWSGDLAQTQNRFAEVMPAAAAIFRDPDIQFHVAYFELAPDEALVVEARPPRCDYWMFVLSNHWLETLDYTRHRITLNNHSAVLEPDGTVKVIVSARDPGHPELARHRRSRARHDRRALGGEGRRGRRPAHARDPAARCGAALAAVAPPGLPPPLDSGYLTDRQIPTEEPP